MWTAAFWKAVAERAGKTLAQSLIAAITVAGASAGFADIDWPRALSNGGVAAVLSVLTSIASYGMGNPGPSLTTEWVAAPPIEHGRHERAE